MKPLTAIQANFIKTIVLHWQESGESPTSEQLATRLNLSKRRIADLITICRAKGGLEPDTSLPVGFREHLKKAATNFTPHQE